MSHPSQFTQSTGNRKPTKNMRNGDEFFIICWNIFRKWEVRNLSSGEWKSIRKFDMKIDVSHRLYLNVTQNETGMWLPGKIYVPLSLEWKVECRDISQEVEAANLSICFMEVREVAYDHLNQSTFQDTSLSKTRKKNDVYLGSKWSLQTIHIGLNKCVLRHHYHTGYYQWQLPPETS